MVQVREHLTRDQRPFLHPESLQILQIHSFFSSVHSLIFYRVQVREHLTRDQRPFLHPESLQILQIHSFFSSVHLTHLLQGSGQRTPDTRSETIPSSRITPDLQIHSFFSSVHSSSTGFRSENTWPEIRDHSFIQNHSRSSDSQLLLFSSPHSSSTGFRFTASPLQFTSLIFYRVQVREHLTRDQRPFLHPESLQIFRFTAPPLQFTSLIFYRVQVREHLTRDQRPFLHPESLQILQIHSFFSSVHLTHLLQGSGQRTPDTRSETIPSSRITPDPSDSQLLLFSSSHSSSTGFRSENTWHEIRDHSFIQNLSRSFRFTASSLQFTSLIFYRVQVREHLTRDQRPFLHPESLQIFRFTASSLQFTHLLQGSGQRTPDQRSETIPSSRITPDLQIHSFSSSVHLTHLLQGSDSQLLLFSSPHLSSTGFRSENTWQEIRDHSFIQNHSRSSDLQLLLFSSPHSSSTGFRSENTWHEIRDHSFIQNHSRSFRFTASSLQFTSLIFYRVQVREHLTRDRRPFLHPESLQTLQIHSFSSSVHLTYLLQGSDQRTPDTRSETIPSSRITPDLQIHSFSSSVHLTHLLQGSGQRTPDTRSETIPSSRITPDPSDSQLLLFSSPHLSSTWFRSENTWHEIRDHSFIQNHSRPFRFTASPLQFTSLIFYRVQIREHLTRDQRPFLHPESLQIFRFTASPLQFTSLIFYRVQVREHLTRDQRPFLHPESLQTLQIHSFFSSVHSLIFYRVQVREHLTRDQRPFLHPESLQILQIHSFFSSVHLTHLLQGSGQRTPDTRSETIPSSRITPDPSDSQLLLFSSPYSSSTGFRSENTWHEIRDHSFIQNHSRPFRFTASSLQFTSLIFYRVQVREHLTRDQRPFLHPESLQTLQIHSFSSSVHLTYLLQGSGQRTPDKSSETIPSSRITPDLQIHSFFPSVHLTHLLQGSDSQLLLFSSPHSFSTGFRSENTWQEIRDHSFVQNLSRSSDSKLLLFSSPHSSSTGFRTENTWQEIRDHFFVQNLSRSSDSQHLLFSSPHSSSTGFRPENTWHEIRDHSFIQNQSRSFRFTASSLQFTSLIFYRVQIHSFSSSVHLTHFLQGSGQRTPDKRSETIPSSRITPDLQIHSFSSSVHLTNLLQGSDSQLLLFSSPHSLSTGFRSENTWQEIRDHSFIQNHSRSFRFTASSLQFTSLVFYRVQVREHLTRDQRPFLHPESLQTLQIHSFSSSVHLTYLLQGSGQRTPDKRSETIPSSRITPDPSDSQLLLFSSPHSSSTGFRSENTWHEIRDHSFIQNLSRSFRYTASSLQFTSLIFSRVQIREHLTRDQRPFLHPESLQILQIHSFFSSVHLTYLLQGSGQRTPDTRSETIPSSRITPDPSDSQLHLFSSPHSSSTGFRSENTWHEIRDHSFIQNHSRLFRFIASPLQFTSLIFYRVQVREHLKRDQRPFLHPESLQIFRFTASSLQFTHLLQGSDSQLLLFSSPHSFSTGFRSENTWQEIRDHSFVQNLSRSSDSKLLLFSSPHSSSTGFRTENTWQEIRDHSFVQNLSRSSDSQLLLFSSPHSSSTGFRPENTWHEIRDHSFIQNQSRSFRFTASSLQFTSLIFYRVQIHSFSSSVHLTHFLQGSGQRTPDKRSETIPSSRITPDLQIHSFSSSVHLTNLLQGSDSQLLLFSSPHSLSTGFRSENTWQEIRDHSFIQNHSRSFRFTASSLQFTSLIFYRVQIREHLTRDQRPFLHPESLQIFRFTASSLQFTSLIFYRVQVREHLTRDQRPFLHPESLQTLQIHSFFSSVHSLIFYRVQVREHLTREKDAQPTERTTALWGLSSKIDSRICVNFTRNGLRLGSRYRSSYEVF